MILTVDVGNTLTKAAVFQNGTLLARISFPFSLLADGLGGLLEKYPEVTDIVVASVTGAEREAFFGFALPVSFVDRGWSFPFENCYETPDTLGIDRMVLAAGAVLAYPRTDRLVIDAGTCVTYDFIDAGDRYRGGAISPGLRLRYESLHRYTAKLPWLETAAPGDIVGASTAASIHSGVVNGLVGEIDGFVSGYLARNPNFTIILTGGDCEFLADKLKNPIFAHQNFLLESLYRTFQYGKHD